MRMRTRTLLGLTAMVVVLAACGSADDGGSAGSPVGDWIAVSGTSDGSNVELIEGFAVKISIDDDQVAGTAACNRYSGGVSIGSDGSFQVDGLSWTEIGCEPAVLELEQSFLAALGDVTSYAVADGVLTLSGESDQWVFASQGNVAG